MKHPAKVVLAFVPLAVLLLALAVSGAPAEEPSGDVSTNQEFELGDGLQPLIQGVSDIVASPLQMGPDWEDLFNADRSLRDDYPPDADGNPKGNGVPDFKELYGGEWAVFTSDIVSNGTAIDTTRLRPDGRVTRGTVDPQHDIGNAYVYTTHDSEGKLVLYAGVERLGTGDSFLELEFNQAHVRLGHGPPWKVTGERTAGDLLVRLTFSGGVIAMSVAQWTAVDHDTFAFQELTGLSGEGCDAAGTACVVCNAGDIEGGPWAPVDTAGNRERLPAMHFSELGIDLGALLASEPELVSVQIRTPQDIAFGYFGEDYWE